MTFDEIAVAALQGLLSNPEKRGTNDNYIHDAILIATLMATELRDSEEDRKESGFS